MGMALAASFLADFKQAQRESWAHFAPLETNTIPCAAHLVRFAGVLSGTRVLDVGCGTGVVAVTAARLARISHEISGKEPPNLA